jgi:hypothetical protein
MIMFLFLTKKIRCLTITEAQSTVMTIFFTCCPYARTQESVRDRSEYPKLAL